MSMLHSLQCSYNQYSQLISRLSKGEPWQPEQVLTMLKSRDRIQHLLDYAAVHPDAGEIPSTFWLDLAQSDAELQKLSVKLMDYKPLQGLQQSYNPPAHYWWWHPQVPEPPKDPREWLWGGLTLAILTVNLALAQDIATRFLTGAPGFWSSIAAIAPVVLALFAGGGALTQLGDKILESVLSNRGPAKRHWSRLKLRLSALLLGGLFVFHVAGLPCLAHRYNSHGERQYFQEGQLAGAQASYERALKLQPDYPEAQFNLGLVYEDLQDFTKAKAEYSKAVHAGHIEAFNNLARLTLLKDKDYDAAVVLLRTALDHKDRNQEDFELEYGLRKNLGWARLSQKRFLEAETELREAIRLDDKFPQKRPDAHCLLAQVLNELDGEAVAKPEWETCLRYVNRPEDDVWAGLAKQALADKETDNAN